MSGSYYGSHVKYRIWPADIADALRKLEISPLEVRGDKAMARCPVCEGSGPHKLDWGIKLDNGQHRCYSCDYHGSFQELVQDSRGLSPEAAWKWITDSGHYRTEITETGLFPPGTAEDKPLYRRVSLPGLRNLPRPPWLIEGLLEEGAVGMLAGQTRSGKSFLALDWACHVAMGKPWFGRGAANRKVLYVSAEGGPGQAPRVAAWEHVNGKIPPGMLEFVIDPVNLADAAFISRLCADISEDFDFVIIDTLARSTVGLEENSAKDMGVVIDNLYKLRDACRECGTTVLVVHHNGYEGNRARGSSALAAGLDFVFQLDCDTPGQPALGMYLRHEKSKNSMPSPVINMLLRWIDMGWENSCVIEEADDIFAKGQATGKILAALAGGAALTIAEIEQAAGLSHGTVSQECGRLVGAGKLTKLPGRPARYQMSAPG